MTWIRPLPNATVRDEAMIIHSLFKATVINFWSALSASNSSMGGCAWLEDGSYTITSYIKKFNKGIFTSIGFLTAQIPANGLTKALPCQKHEAFIKMLGLVNIQDKIGLTK
jgi:hypothetical protein